MAPKVEPKCTVDPVCNLDLTAAHGQYAYDFEDETYWFCSELCREEFAADPGKYLKFLRKDDQK